MASMETKVVYSLRGRIVQRSRSPGFDGKDVKRRKHVSIAYEDDEASTSASSRNTIPDAGHALEEKKEVISSSSRRQKRYVAVRESILSYRILQ